jgi:hypothetical protein
MLSKQLLLLIAFVVFILLFVKMRMRMKNNKESFNGYVNTRPLYHGYEQSLLKPKLRPGIESEYEKLTPLQMRAAFVRLPEPRLKFKCNIDKHLNRHCRWEKVYNKFYPDLLGKQKSLIKP